MYMRMCMQAAELAPFASELHTHLTLSALSSRGAELDMRVLDIVLGCAFLHAGESFICVFYVNIHAGCAIHTKMHILE